jgi:hypothetical protein
VASNIASLDFPFFAKIFDTENDTEYETAMIPNIESKTDRIHFDPEWRLI